MQMLVLMGIISVFSVLGMLAPPNRGSVLTAIVVLYLLLGFLAGYTSAKMYKQFAGTKTLSMVGLGLVLVPGTVLFLFFLNNMIMWDHSSSAGLSAWMVLGAFVLWGVHSVLCLMGMFLGVRVASVRFPTAVNNIPRFIPKQPWYNNRIVVFLCAGVIPFAVFWIELYYLLQAIWMGHWVATFAFVFISVMFLTLATAFVSIMAVFLRLRTEDYHWWWRSFWIGTTPVLYIFLYMMYFIRYMKLMSLASLVIYIVYSTLFCFSFAIYLGGVGIFASYYFVFTIYEALPSIE
jgi:transmembrane 9 superfamily protein 2/4